MLRRITLGLCVLMLLAACDSKVEPIFPSDLEDFATRYAAAWSGQDPAVWAAFYADDATFRINDGEVSVGRAAIEETARSFMAGFPDMDDAEYQRQLGAGDT